MAFIEYTKYGNEYLVTDFKKEKGGELKLRFTDTERAALIIGKSRYEIENGILTVNSNLLSEGIHTPFLLSDSASFKCDEIKIEAGCAVPHFSESARDLLFAKSIIWLTAKLSEIEKELKKLNASVYGSSIL